MYNIEEKLRNQNKMPAFYKRYVDDTLSKMPDVSCASELTLNEIQPLLSFTMELEDNGKLPFLGNTILMWASCSVNAGFKAARRRF